MWTFMSQTFGQDLYNIAVASDGYSKTEGSQIMNFVARTNVCCSKTFQKPI